MAHTLDDLLRIMAALRDPDTGCPWDRKQTFATIAPYTIEEAYEVADAIAQGDLHELREELGDLLFQVVFYAQLGKEQRAFAFDDVVEAICEKLVRRHPHVFEDTQFDDDEALHAAWEAEKKRERAAKGKDESVLDGVARALPALVRAQKLQKRAARVGFDWPDVSGVIAKLREEIDELEAEIGTDQLRAAEELGDMLFAMVNLARHLGIEPEGALREANAKFERRFRGIEQRISQAGQTMNELDLETLDAHWDAVKRDEPTS
ncbi:MAG: nucleoside triphosphate pyrophosphohydrolase [Granulosicoccaceae bacterium]|jgi:MazG family protein